MKQEAVQPPVFRFSPSMKIIFTFRLYSASDCGDIINERNGSQAAGKRERDEGNAGEYIRIPSSGDGSSDGRNDGGNPAFPGGRKGENWARSGGTLSLPDQGRGEYAGEVPQKRACGDDGKRSEGYSGRDRNPGGLPVSQ